MGELTLFGKPLARRIVAASVLTKVVSAGGDSPRLLLKLGKCLNGSQSFPESRVVRPSIGTPGNRLAVQNSCAQPIVPN